MRKGTENNGNRFEKGEGDPHWANANIMVYTLLANSIDAFYKDGVCFSCFFDCDARFNGSDANA